MVYTSDLQEDRGHSVKMAAKIKMYNPAKDMFQTKMDESIFY